MMGAGAASAASSDSIYIREWNGSEYTAPTSFVVDSVSIQGMYNFNLQLSTADGVAFDNFLAYQVHQPNGDGQCLIYLDTPYAEGATSVVINSSALDLSQCAGFESWSMSLVTTSGGRSFQIGYFPNSFDLLPEGGGWVTLDGADAEPTPAPTPTPEPTPEPTPTPTPEPTPEPTPTPTPSPSDDSDSPWIGAGGPFGEMPEDPGYGTPPDGEPTNPELCSALTINPICLMNSIASLIVPQDIVIKDFTQDMGTVFTSRFPFALPFAISQFFKGLENNQNTPVLDINFKFDFNDNPGECEGSFPWRTDNQLKKMYCDELSITEEFKLFGDDTAAMELIRTMRPIISMVFVCLIWIGLALQITRALITHAVTKVGN